MVAELPRRELAAGEQDAADGGVDGPATRGAWWQRLHVGVLKLWGVFQATRGGLFWALGWRTASFGALEHFRPVSALLARLRAVYAEFVGFRKLLGCCRAAGWPR
jgi:hypothetical protein